MYLKIQFGREEERYGVNKKIFIKINYHQQLSLKSIITFKDAILSFYSKKYKKDLPKCNSVILLPSPPLISRTCLNRGLVSEHGKLGKEAKPQTQGLCYRGGPESNWTQEVNAGASGH